MTILLLIAGLGVALGLAFRIAVLVLASAFAAAALFAVSYFGGASLASSALNALLGLVALQVGYFGGMVFRYLAGAASRAADVVPDEIGELDGATLPPLSRLPRPPAAPPVPQAVSAQALDERLVALLDHSPSFVLVLRGPDHVVEHANQAFRDLTGARVAAGLPLREALPELAGQGYFELLDQVFASRQGQKRTHVPVRLTHAPNGAGAPRIIDFVAEPIRDGGGRVAGIFIDGQDVTAAARADDRFRELDRQSQSTIDALAEFIAVVRADGTVARINKAWKDFAGKGRALPDAVEGANYLSACDQAAAGGDRDAEAVAGQIRRVLSGKAKHGEWEYEGGHPDGRRTYLLKVNRFSGDHSEGVVITQEDVSERRSSERRIEYLATHDALTGLPNRNLLEDRTKQAVERSRRSGQRFALLAIDLDNFKQLNEAYGHSVGDATISACALRIATAAKEWGDTVARLGSDEFVVVLADVDDAATAASRVARAVQDAIKMPMAILDDQEFTLSASVGISLYPADGERFDGLLKNAQAALHRAKALGRGGYQFYSPEMSARANERVIFEGELRRALSREQFEIHFQPQVAVDTGALIGVEALVRWRHPELGWLQPGRFIPIAEETGLIDPLGRYILREACLQSQAWRLEGVPPVPVAVNIAAAQLRHADFLPMVEQTIAETGIDPKLLELEITEGTMMEVSEPLLSRIDGLKQLGIRLSIDDFGTGYSNLAYLRTFPLDRLKIDQTFIASATHDEGSQSIVRAILGLGESLGLEVVAEGVETPEQAALLDRLGCRQAQGFLYGKPMPADDLVAWVRSREQQGRRQAGGEGRTA